MAPLQGTIHSAGALMERSPGAGVSLLHFGDDLAAGVRDSESQDKICLIVTSPKHACHGG